MITLLTASVTVLLGAALAAQGRTWIVDQNNGAGTDFTDLPPAVAAAADGDTLVIRTGTYSPFDTGKALTLLGQGGVVVRDLFQFPLAVVRVAGLPGGRSFVMKNVRVEAFATSTTMSLSGNAGRVHLEGVEAVAPAIPPTTVQGCQIISCNEVTILNGRLSGFPALSASASLVAIAGTDVAGGDACGSSRCPYVGLGMLLQDATVLLSRANVRGGNGSLNNPLALPRSAIRMVRSTVQATGDGTTRILAGGLSGAGPVPAIDTELGALHLDTRIVVMGSQSGPDVSGTAVVVRRRIVSLAGAGAPPGGTATAEIVSPAGDPFLLAASLPSDPLPHPAGLVFLDLQYLTPIASGIQGTGERFALNIPVPPNPALRGAAIALQASSLRVPAVAIEFSNPVVVVLD